MQKRDMSRGNDTNRDEQERAPTSSVPQELADVCARFADICDYSSRQRMDLPPEVLETIGRVLKLSIPERIARMDELNRELMDYLHAAGQDFGIRH
jgi:hypothetical protein